jgi:hypothetical protein
MFCPICRAEYRRGFTKCSDCKVQLVCDLPPGPPESEAVYVDYKEMLETFNPMDIALLKSILDAENITYFFQGEHFLHVRPLALPARLMVKTDQVEKAKEVLSNFNLTFSGINLEKDTDKNS